MTDDERRDLDAALADIRDAISANLRRIPKLEARLKASPDAKTQAKLDGLRAFIHEEIEEWLPLGLSAKNG